MRNSACLSRCSSLLLAMALALVAFPSSFPCYLSPPPSPFSPLIVLSQASVELDGSQARVALEGSMRVKMVLSSSPSFMLLPLLLPPSLLVPPLSSLWLLLLQSSFSFSPILSSAPPLTPSPQAACPDSAPFLAYADRLREDLRTHAQHLPPSLVPVALHTQRSYARAAILDEP